MQRYAILLATAAFFGSVAAACTDDTPLDCFESGASPYAVTPGGDTTVIFRWPDSYEPVRYYGEPVAENVANVTAGLQLWVNAFRCNEMSVQVVSDSTEADVMIMNPANMPPLPAGGAAFFADSVGACQGRTDILLDSTSRLELPVRVYVTPANIDPVAVAACYHFVVAHEIGHTLGLFAHSPTSGDLMNSTPRRRELTPRDRITIQLLYHMTGSLLILPQPR